MERDLSSLCNNSFDMVVVGGGIHGACVARDAALRGLRVALVEQGDFCSATSHNSLKTIHGGIRYLQHLNFKRAIESIREQQILLRTMPHLIQRLRFLMPTYGYGIRGPFAMAAGLGMFELMSTAVALWDRRALAWPASRLMRRSTCLHHAPGIDATALTGGAIWADAQVAYADKAVFQILQHAVDHGAVVANYTKAQGLRFDPEDSNRVTGIVACDQQTGDVFDIDAGCVMNATGPWVADWISDAAKPAASARVGLVSSMNIVTNKPAPKTAIAVKSARASDSRIDTAKRMFFVVPWQGKAVIGTTHFTYDGSPSGIKPDHAEIAQFVDEYNAADTAMGLTVDDVLYCYLGLTPGDDAKDADGAKLHESKIINHAEADATSDLISIVSIKWTTARLVAERAVDRFLQNRGETRPCQTRQTAVPDTPQLGDRAQGLTDAQLRAFVENHIAQTQAHHLDDIVLRRMDDLVLGKLTADQLRLIMSVMAAHFDWSVEQQQAELDRVLNRLHSSHYQQSIRRALQGVTS